MALALAYKVRSYSTGTLGRAICNARTHHFVADDPGGDEVGAGDAFAASFAYGLLQSWAPPDCARAGNALAARALAGTGDWETLPRLADLQKLLQPAEPR